MWKKEPDPVVREVPVYLAKGLSGQLCLLQYPLIPLSVPIQDELSVIQAQIKPGQDKLQLKVELDTGVRYNKEKGEAFQSAADGKILRPDTDLRDKSTLLTEQILESVGIPANSKSQRYVIGIIKDDQLHLTPLTSILQMQNKFWYLNAADKNTKMAKEMEEDEGEEEAAEVQPTKITLQFKQSRGGGGRGGGEGAKPKHPRSFHALAVKNEEEPWTELDYFHRGDNEEGSKLLSEVKESDVPFFVVEKNNYLTELFPKHVETEVEGTQSLFASAKSTSKILPVKA